MIEKYKKIPLFTKLLVAMVIGILLGVIFGEKINVIKPFVVNLISGIAQLDDPKIFGRVGVKIMFYYACTTMITPAQP